MIETSLEWEEPGENLLELRQASGVKEWNKGKEGDEANYHAEEYESMRLEDPCRQIQVKPEVVPY